MYEPMNTQVDAPTPPRRRRLRAPARRTSVPRGSGDPFARHVGSGTRHAAVPPLEPRPPRARRVTLAPDEIPVSVRTRMRGVWSYPRQPKEVYGAVMPILVTVNVPARAKPGRYEGKLTITMAGAAPR